jgi:hypothetical protein
MSALFIVFLSPAAFPDEYTAGLEGYSRHKQKENN